MARSKISDSPSSSSTFAIDEKEKARQIITQLNSKSINPRFFVRYASFPRQNSIGFASNDPFALGPIFIDHCPQELVDIFPYSKNIQPLYLHRNAKWGPFSTEIKFEPWPLPKSDWFTWVDRMYIGLKEKLEYLGIADAIITSKTPIKPDTHLITALISFWSTTSNTFVFNEGFLSPTLMDVSAMLSLPIEGIPIHHEMKCTQYSTIDLDTNGSALGYTRFMQKHKKHFDEAITFEEETCFYLFWLCKFLINSPSKRIVTYYLPIAIALANKHKLALAPFFLVSVYRSVITPFLPPGFSRVSARKTRQPEPSRPVPTRADHLEYSQKEGPRHISQGLTKFD
jgi:hypothetical protein